MSKVKSAEELKLDQLFRESLDNDYDTFEASLNNEGVNITVLLNLEKFMNNRYWALANVKDALLVKKEKAQVNEVLEIQNTVDNIYILLALLEKKLGILNEKIKSLAIKN